MTGLNHAATGITIALIFKRPEIAIPLSLLSHFVLDSVPHSFVPLNKKRIFTSYLLFEAVSMIAITILCMIVFPEIWLLIGVCAFVAFMPDTLWPFYYNGRLKNVVGFKQFYAFHKKIQWSETYRGWLNEVLYFAVLVIFISNYHMV